MVDAKGIEDGAALVDPLEILADVGRQHVVGPAQVEIDGVDHVLEEGLPVHLLTDSAKGTAISHDLWRWPLTSQQQKLFS